MTLIEILEYASDNGIEVRIYNFNCYERGIIDLSYLHPKDSAYYLELRKEDRRFRTIINSYKGMDKSLFSHPQYGDEKFKEWLYDVIEVFLNNHEEKRKSEYSTPINQDLGILGE